MKRNLDQIILEPSHFSIGKLFRKPATYLTTLAVGLLSCEASPGTPITPSNPEQECYGSNCSGITNTPPSNKVMDQTSAYYLNSISADKSTLIFSAQSTYAQNLISGDLIIAGITDKTEEGLLRKVTSTTKNPSQVVVYTVQATLEEAVPEGTVQLSFNLPTGNAKADSASGDFGSTQLPLSFSGGQVVEFDHTELFSGIYLDGSMHIAVNADFQFKNSTLYGTKEVRFVTKGLEELELIVSGEFHSGINKEQPPLELVKFPTLVITPPGLLFPVVITPHLYLTFGVEANGNISAETSITQSLVLDAGLEYKNNAWSKIQNIQPEFSSTPPEFTGASGDFTVYVKPQLTLDFYGVDGPYAGFKGYLKALATITPPDSVSCSILAGLEALVGVNVEILGKTLLDYETAVYTYETEVANCSGEPVACQDKCDYGQTTCQGDKVMTCATSNDCTKWVPAVSCGGGQICKDGDCVEDVTDCAPNKYYLECYQGDVWWFNTCDNIYQEYDNCDFGEKCEDGQCKSQLENSCLDLVICINGCYTETCAEECFSQASPKAQQEFSDTFSCITDVCGDNPSDECIYNSQKGSCKDYFLNCFECLDECIFGLEECVGNGWRECDNYDSDICHEWSPPNQCGSEEYCENGLCKCPIDQFWQCGDGGCIHNSLVCDGKKDCSNGIDESNFYCGSVPETCSTDADCGSGYICKKSVSQCFKEPSSLCIGSNCTDVGIHVWDSGSEKDDSFGLEIVGEFYGETDYGGGKQWTIPMVKNKTYEMFLYGISVPDGIGTYTLKLTNATFTDGPDLIDSYTADGSGLDNGISYIWSIKTE